MIEPKIAIIAYPHTRSSYVMDVFDKAGFALGDVDRRPDEGYPAGRLELRQLAALTSGKSKTIPLTDWPQSINTKGVQVAKCLPAWIPVLKAQGFNYWVAAHRGETDVNSLSHEANEVLNSNREFDPRELWARAYDHINGAPSGKHTERDTPTEAHDGERLHGQENIDQSGHPGATVRRQKRRR